MFRPYRIFRSADDTGNGTGNNGGNAGGSNAGGGDGNQANGSQNSGGGENGGGSQEPEKKFTQADLDRLIGETRTSEKAKYEKKLADDKAAAEAAEAAKKGEFEKLYNSEKEKVANLTNKAALADELSTVINQSIDDESKDWPEEVRQFDPGKDDVKARSAWVAKARKLAASLGAAQRPPKGEHGQQGGGNQDQKTTTDTYLKSQYEAPKFG